MLHAVLHRALVGADLVVAAVQQCLAAGVHAQRDFIVLVAGFQVGSLLGGDKFGLECGNFLGVEKLDQIQRLLRALREQRGHHEHVRVPLDHHRRVVGQPDRAVFRNRAVAVLLHRGVPALVNRRSGRTVGLRQCLVDADGLHRMVFAEFPAQVFTADKTAQPGMERPDVVVLQIDLDKGLPVVVALVEVTALKHITAEVQLGCAAKLGQVGNDCSSVALEQQALPVLQRVVAQVQAGVLLKMRCANQRAMQVVGPAVQRTDDVLARSTDLAASLEHDCLAMAADVRDQLDAIGRVHQRATFPFLRQRQVVAGLGHGEFVPQITRRMVEDELLFAAEQALVEIAANGKLSAVFSKRALKSFETGAQVRHDPWGSSCQGIELPPGGPAGGKQSPARQGLGRAGRNSSRGASAAGKSALAATASDGDEVAND